MHAAKSTLQGCFCVFVFLCDSLRVSVCVSAGLSHVLMSLLSVAILAEPCVCVIKLSCGAFCTTVISSSLYITAINSLCPVAAPQSTQQFLFDLVLSGDGFFFFAGKMKRSSRRHRK